MKKLIGRSRPIVSQVYTTTPFMELTLLLVTLLMAMGLQLPLHAGTNQFLFDYGCD